MFRALCVRRQEVKIVLYSIWYRHTCRWPSGAQVEQSIYYSVSSLYMFRVSATPIIRSTQICNCSLRYWSYFLCSYLPPTWPSLATLEGGSCTEPEAVVTVLFTPDDWCGWQPKHVEWTCRIINKLFCVASRWTISNKDCCMLRHPSEALIHNDHTGVSIKLLNTYNFKIFWNHNNCICE